MNDLREKLAELAHSQWSGWMKYIFSPSKGSLCLSGWLMNLNSYMRWERQMNTNYDDLSESEKTSDRIEADKFIAAIQPYLDEKDARIQELTALVYDLVAQSCRDGDRFDSDGISVYEDAIALLVDAGRLRLVPAGRIIAVPVEPHD